MNYFLGLDSATNVLVADFEDTADGTNHPAIAATGTRVATPGVWHHAAATYDGSTWRLYLDGQLDRAVNIGAFTPESTSIQYALPRESHVKLVVYNLVGEQVAVLVDERKNAGFHTATFSASALPSGMYVYWISAGGTTMSRKMLLVK
jgi:hypothetical protein